MVLIAIRIVKRPVLLRVTDGPAYVLIVLQAVGVRTATQLAPFTAQIRVTKQPVDVKSVYQASTGMCVAWNVPPVASAIERPVDVCVVPMDDGDLIVPRSVSDVLKTGHVTY